MRGCNAMRHDVCGVMFQNGVCCCGCGKREPAASSPRTRVRSKGCLSQPLPLGRVLHLARGQGYVSASLGRKTPTYPAMPQYRFRGLLVRWEVTHD